VYLLGPLISGFGRSIGHQYFCLSCTCNTILYSNPQTDDMDTHIFTRITQFFGFRTVLAVLEILLVVLTEKILLWPWNG